jgi:hypothetical protein
VREQGLLCHQVARLVRSLLATDEPAARRAILADPARWLAGGPAASPQRAGDPRLSAGGNELRRCLLRFEGSASRLGSRLLSHAGQDLSGEAARLLAPLLRQARTAGSRAVALLDEVTGGGPRDVVARPSAKDQGVANAQPPG